MINAEGVGRQRSKLKVKPNDIHLYFGILDAKWVKGHIASVKRLTPLMVEDKWFAGFVAKLVDEHEKSCYDVLRYLYKKRYEAMKGYQNYCTPVPGQY